MWRRYERLQNGKITCSLPIELSFSSSCKMLRSILYAGCLAINLVSASLQIVSPINVIHSLLSDISQDSRCNMDSSWHESTCPSSWGWDQPDRKYILLDRREQTRRLCIPVDKLLFQHRPRVLDIRQ